MQVVERLTAVMDDRAELMRRMLGRLDIDLVAAAHAGWGTQVSHAARSCLMCRHGKACRAWLDGAPIDGYDSPVRFCPNARLFEEMARDA